MNHARLAALACAGALAACGKSKATAPGIGLDAPASAAVFRGFTTAADTMQPYLAIANELRNDLTLVNADTGAAVLAPIQLRSLAVPVQSRPTIVVSASLGDLDASQNPLPDLLVAISGNSDGSGNSSVQLVRTWRAPNEVVTPETPIAGEVLAAVAVPNPPGTTGKARIALALSGHRVAVLHYRRTPAGTGADAGAIEVDGSLADPAPVATLDTGTGVLVQPVALAASDDGSRVYAATPDTFASGAQGVAEIDVPSGAAPAFSRALAARAPTRLVAFARLQERVTGPATSSASAAPDATAFGWPSAPQPSHARVYAVLDESGCGPGAPIECGVAVLDADPAGTARIVGDVVAPSGTTVAMPYLAPIPLPSRALAIAVSPPPSRPPASEPLVLHPDDPTYHGDLMRVWPTSGAFATTAVAAVAAENGRVYFVDLGRWRIANGTSTGGNAVQGARAIVQLATTPTAVPEGGTVRLTLEELAPAGGTTPALLATIADAGAPTPKFVRVTPGYTRDEALAVTYQGALPSLSERRAEAVGVDAGQARLALQVTGGTGAQAIATQVVRLWDPSLGVRVGDVVQIGAAAVAALDPACVGTVAPGAAAASSKIFEAKVAALVAPSAAFPGGAVQLAAEDRDPLPVPFDTTAAAAKAAWSVCLDRLAAAAQAGPVPNLTASILAGGFVVTSNARGYLDRIDALGTEWRLDYDAGEDTLSCPIVPWPATLGAMACDPATCRPACEHLLRVRKARRVHHVAATCGTDQTSTTVATCLSRFPADQVPGNALPDVAGPAVAFKLAIDAQGTATRPAPPAVPRRGLSVGMSTVSGVSILSAPATSTSNLGSMTHPNGVVPFDRSRDVEGGDYRFFVPYVGDWVLDTSPSAEGAASGVIR